MTATAIDLTPGQVGTLRAAHPFVSGLAPGIRGRSDRWVDLNRRYLEEARASSARAMRALMREAGIGRVGSLDEAADLIELAIRVFAPEGGYRGRIERPRPGVLVISNAECPMFESLQERDWHGITACSSWHSRQGWYDALGIVVSDSVLREKKWGDRACVAELRIEDLAR